jgi:hypothetical protein
MSENGESSPSWLGSGYEGIEEEEKRLTRLAQPRRFWVKEGGSTEAVFIDSDPSTIYEHNVHMNGSWRNWFTCGKGFHDEAACCAILGPRNAYYVGYYTVVDCRKWTDDSGKDHQYELQMLPAKLGMLKIFRRKNDDRADEGGLSGCMFKVHREGDKSPGIGSEWEFKRRADLEKLYPLATYKGKLFKDLVEEANNDPKKHALLAQTFQLVVEDSKIQPVLVPFNYAEILLPMKPSEVREYLHAYTGARKSGGGSDGGGGDIREDDTPF